MFFFHCPPFFLPTCADSTCRTLLMRSCLFVLIPQTGSLLFFDVPLTRLAFSSVLTGSSALWFCSTNISSFITYFWSSGLLVFGLTSRLGLLACVIFCGLIALFGFSFYLEFCSYYFEFKIKLWAFFFAVWCVVQVGTGIGLLVSWEVVGWISFRLISHWTDRSAALKQGLLAIFQSSWWLLFWFYICF